MAAESVKIVAAAAAGAPAAAARVLTPDALAFVAGLERQFGARRRELLSQRQLRQARFDAGERPDFLKETRRVREMDWRVAPAPADLDDRRVEITGPVDRKMIVNALNSGAKVFMADLEDATSPVWANVVDGQANVADAIRRQIDFTSAEGSGLLLIGDARLTATEPFSQLDLRDADVFTATRQPRFKER